MFYKEKHFKNQNNQLIITLLLVFTVLREFLKIMLL